MGLDVDITDFHDSKKSVEHAPGVSRQILGGSEYVQDHTADRRGSLQ